MISKRVLALCAGLVALFLVGGVALAATSADLTLRWQALTAGGGDSASEAGGIGLTGSFGQPVVGASSSADGSIGLGGGYWYGAGPTVFPVSLPLILRSS
jgi:hypothetical protein